MGTLPDVLVVGGGIIGLSSAYYLARAGARVVLIDRDDLGRQASWAGAGIISPGNPDGARTPADFFRARSSAMYARLSEELHQQTGIDNGYRVCGGLQVAQSGEEGPDPEWSSEGIPFTPLEGDDLRRLEPDLGPGAIRGYLLPGMAQVRNPRHLRALGAACERLEVGLRPHCPAQSFRRRGDRVEAIESDAGPLAAGSFLVATGAWTDDLAAGLGWRPGVRPVRGQMALLDTGRPGVRPIVLGGKRYVVRRDDGRALVGSTVEDAGFNARPTAGGIAGLLEFAAGLLPSLAGAPLERCWAGLRPGSPDGLPFLGRVPGSANVFVAAGHFRSGIELSPATGLVMSELILGRPPSLSLEPFRPDRLTP
jgi:glycine oxidase